MPLARWPNEGFVKVVESASAKQPRPGTGPPGPKKASSPTTATGPPRWTEDPDIVLYGYWFYDWADSYERVEWIDLEKKEITLAPPFHTYGYRAGQPFYAVNLLSEIDQPGEWYLDRRSRRALLLSALGSGAGRGRALRRAGPVRGAGERIARRLRGADLGAGLRRRHPCPRRRALPAGRLHGPALRAATASRFSGGTAHGLLSCDIHSMGRGGAVMTGGDRKTLDARRPRRRELPHPRSLAHRPHLHAGGAARRRGQPHRPQPLHDIRSSAMRLEGNDHSIEFNEVAPRRARIRRPGRGGHVRQPDLPRQRVSLQLLAPHRQLARPGAGRPTAARPASGSTTPSAAR